jgi:membrane fusion protein, multidrug efflux system
VPVDTAFVDANFKESQLGKVRIGQRATLIADIYGGDVTYHGRVTGFAGGTGATFSLIPAQNATGNWVKVIQRVPVHIALDPAELRDHPLRVGMSMDVIVDTRMP